MRILAVGGGSGGHVTPVVAVLREVKRLQPNAQIRFWCDKKFAQNAQSIVDGFDRNIPVQIINAGKFRRYYHLSFLRQLLWPSVVLQNFRDLFLVIVGFIQSLVKLIVWRPNVIFLKGGYVSLPVGVAAHVLRIPYVIHDSDAHPGLTNRILSRWASAIATGAPLENYQYPSKISKYVGIPVRPEFHKFTEAERHKAKEQWGIEKGRPLIVITGGGLGAMNINDTVAIVLKDLMKLGSVVLISGDAQYDELRSLTPQNSEKFQLYPFISDELASLLGAADVVVSRAGATFIVELASMAKPTILIPNPKLAGGHQLKNALVYEKAGAVKVVDEEAMIKDPQILVSAIHEVLSDPNKASGMAKVFAEFARPKAAHDVAEMVVKAAK